MAKKWSQLSKRTKQRYTRAGVTWRDYNAGNITPLQRERATGKRATSFAQQRARAHGLFKTIPRAEFNRLPADEKLRVIDSFNAGYGAPRSPFERSRGAYVPTSTEHYPWIPESEIVSKVDANGHETYYRDFIDRNGKHRRVPLPNYGKPISPLEEYRGKVNFQSSIDEYGIQYENEWNDAIRDALAASSPTLGGDR